MKKFILIFIFYTIWMQDSLSQQDTLIYIGDPMCSWCYGFGPELDKIKEAFPNTPMEMVMGGLRAGGTEKIADLKDFLYQHWLDVQNTSGVKINFNILRKGEILYDTEPACRAVIIAGNMNPEIKYDFFKEVQKSFYLYNDLPNEEDTYVQIAAKLGLDPEIFHKNFRNRQSSMNAYSDFDLATAMGVQGFPTLIAKIEGKLYLVTNGYQKADKIILSLRNRGLE